MVVTSRNIPVARPSFDADEERELLDALRSGWVTQGPRVAEFEKRFAAVVEAEHAVALSSCTTALFLALHSLGIGPGDEVIVPSLTFIASVNPIVHVGAVPVLVDVDPESFNIAPQRVAEAITPRTRAVMPVHQLGHPADLEAIQKIANDAAIAVVEDSACAVGARYRGRPIGASGNLNCWSFHPRKVLVTGEGGMITTNDADVATRLRRLRHQGMSISDVERDSADEILTEEYPEVGFNFRMSDLHAALGLAQLPKLDRLVARRRELAARYDAAFAEIDAIARPEPPPSAEPNQQSYIARLRHADRASRDAFLNAMKRRRVATRRGLMAVHRERPYRIAPDNDRVRAAGSLHHSELADAQTVILPLYPELSEADQDYVIEQIPAALEEAGALEPAR